MSGTIGSNIGRHSGNIAVTAAGLSWTTAVVTGSTVTVEAGNGYFINTTSNACTVTLPSSAEAGDQIVLVDYARTWGTNKITIDSNGLNYQGDPDTFTVEYTTAGQSLNIVYSDSTKGWLPLEDDVAADEPYVPLTQRAIFAYGNTGSVTAVSNLVNSSGTVASDVTGVGSAREGLTASGYGVDKAIFGYGYTDTDVSMTNLVSNVGVIGTDVTGVGTARSWPGAAAYGGDKAIFGYGDTGSETATAITNLVTNAGVVGSDVSGVGTARFFLTAAEYGEDKAIFGFGNTGSATAITNLVTNAGVVGSDVSGVGTARDFLGATGYGEDKAIFGFGRAGASILGVTNLVSNSGVVASDVSAVGTARRLVAAAEFSCD